MEWVGAYNPDREEKQQPLGGEGHPRGGVASPCPVTLPVCICPACSPALVLVCVLNLCTCAFLQQKMAELHLMDPSTRILWQGV